MILSAGFRGTGSLGESPPVGDRGVVFPERRAAGQPGTIFFTIIIGMPEMLL